MNSQTIFLILFLVLVIPLILSYLEHAIIEFQAHDKAKSETKKIKTASEGLFFLSIAVGYALTTLFIIIFPKDKIPYIVVLVGTVAIVILYYYRIYGIPIPGTDIVITDLSQDWRDFISKTLQQALVIPLSILFTLCCFTSQYNTNNKK